LKITKMAASKRDRVERLKTEAKQVKQVGLINKLNSLA